MTRVRRHVHRQGSRRIAQGHRAALQRARATGSLFAKAKRQPILETVNLCPLLAFFSPSDASSSRRSFLPALHARRRRTKARHVQSVQTDGDAGGTDGGPQQDSPSQDLADAGTVTFRWT